MIRVLRRAEVVGSFGWHSVAVVDDSDEPRPVDVAAHLVDRGRGFDAVVNACCAEPQPRNHALEIG
jgi:hypothetical protein